MDKMGMGAAMVSVVVVVCLFLIGGVARFLYGICDEKGWKGEAFK